MTGRVRTWVAGLEPRAAAAGLALFGLTVLTLLASASPGAALVSLASHAACAAPGLWIVARACEGRGRWLPVVAFGPLAGLAATSATLLAFWAAGARGPWTLVAAPAALLPLAWLAPRFRGRWHPIAPAASDGFWLCLLLLLVPLVVARPFSLVGAILPEGEVYRAYFTADFIWRRAVVAELAKGDFLPLNPFFLHDALHYYWLPHLLNAVEYRWLGADVNALLLAESVLVDIAFVTLLYGVARIVVTRPALAAAGVACSLLATSFEGLYGLWSEWQLGAPLALLRFLNIDALSRWLLGGMPVDGLQRLLWYQPHHALGYAVGLLGLLAITRRTRAVDPGAFALGGVLLGLATLLSSFGGLMLTTAAALHEGLAVTRHLAWRRAVLHLVSAAVPLALAASLVLALRYVDAGGPIIQVGLNPVAVHNLVPATVLSFGPMLLLAGPGLYIGWRRGCDVSALAALLAVSAVFYFLVDIRDHQNVYVGWRVGHLTFIACGTLVGLTFDALGTRPLAWGGVALVLVAALPTVAIDAYNTQDIANRERAAGFRWTLVVSRDELEAFDWIRAHTPPDSVFQVDPVARDPETWAYLAAFGERRMVAGLPISMVPLDKYLYESGRIRRIFDEPPIDAHSRARLAGVQYVLVGPPERAAHPDVLARFDEVPYLFAPAFRNGTIAIYRVVGSLP